ncbi:MAG: EamA family transporter [Devosiaceae bacterium]|nr:EamA family transporter [Devosiaceae bacterium]
MRFLDWVMLLALSALWGGSFFFVGVAVSELPPLTIITLRISIAALALLLFLQISRKNLPMPGTTTWAAIIALAIFATALAYVLYFRILSSAGLVAIDGRIARFFSS